MATSWVFCLMSFIATVSATTPPQGAPKRLVLHSEAEITLDQYVESADVFLFTHNAEPDVGPNFVTPENFKTATGQEGTMTEFRQKMKGLVGNIFVLKRDMPLLWLKEVEDRKKAKKK